MATLLALRLSDGELVHAYQDHSLITLAFDEKGPVGGGFTIPAGNAGGSVRVLRPDGYGALVAIDARDEGVPQAWLGQVSAWGEDEAAGGFDVNCSGPWDGWLASVPVPDIPARKGCASLAAWTALQRGAPQPPHRLLPGALSGGAVVDVASSGASAASMVQDLAGRAGEEVTIRPIAGQARAWLDWRSPFDAMDARGDVTLVPGWNCHPGQRGGNFASAPDSLAGIANPVNLGRAMMGATVSFAVRPSLGRRARLAASQHVHVARKLAAGQPIVRPDLPSASAMVSTLRAELASADPIGEASFIVTDSTLYPYMQPRTLISCVLANDTTGLYSRAELQVTTATWSVANDRVESCTISARLWSTGDES